MSKVKNKIILVCTDCLARNYSIPKSTISQRNRLEINKYCSTCNKHTLHKETR